MREVGLFSIRCVRVPEILDLQNTSVKIFEEGFLCVCRFIFFPQRSILCLLKDWTDVAEDRQLQSAGDLVRSSFSISEIKTMPNRSWHRKLRENLHTDSCQSFSGAESGNFQIVA